MEFFRTRNENVLLIVSIVQRRKKLKSIMKLYSERAEVIFIGYNKDVTGTQKREEYPLIYSCM